MERRPKTPNDGVSDTANTRTNDGPPRVKSAEILGHGREAIIEHAGEDYRLRCTSKGKLILTK